MTTAELLEEAQQLARPCTYLVRDDQGSPATAIWGEPGPTAPSSPGAAHWLTVDTELLPHGLAKTGMLSLRVLIDEPVLSFTNQPFSNIGHCEGTLLYPRSATSLPPIDAVFRFGSPRLHEWLHSNDWRPNWGYNSNFKAVEAAEYQEIFQEQFPLYTGTAYAVLGGWHFPWPDDDWEDLLAEKLLLTTFHDSEPWYEVWLDSSGNFRAVARVT